MSSPTKFDARQTEMRSALSMIGSSANATLDGILSKINDEIAKLYEDRNVQLAGGGTISWSGTVISFSANLFLSFNQKVSGAAPTSVNLGAVNKTLSADSRMYYAVVDRNTFTATLFDDATALPAVTSANQEVFLIAKRVGTDLYFRNNVVIQSGKSITFTKGSDFYGALGATTNAIVKTNGTDGKTMQASAITIDASNNLTTPGVFRMTIAGSLSGGSFFSMTANQGAVSNTAVVAVENNSRGNSTGFQAASFGTASSPIPGLFTYSSRGTGSVPTGTLNGDYLGLFTATGYDNTGAQVGGNGSATINMVATETFSTTSRATAINFHTTAVGSTSLNVSPVVSMASDLTSFSVPIYSQKFIRHDFLVDASTTGSNAAVTLTNEGVIKLTNGSLVSINNISAGQGGRLQTLINSTGNTITIIDNAGGTANQRILTGGSGDIAIPNNGTVDLIYDFGTSRWRIRGVNGSAVTLNGVQTLTNKTLLGEDNIIRNVQVFNSNHTGDITLNASHEVVYCNASGASFTVTFPAASSNTFKQYIIKKTDSSFNFINLTGSGLTTNQLMTIGETVTYISNGINWIQTHRTTETEWISYAVTWLNQSGGTLPTKASSPVGDQGYWRRVGDSIQVKYDYYQTNPAGALNGTGGEFHFAIPNHTVWTIDSSKILNVGTGSQRTLVGPGYFQVNGIGWNTGCAQLAGTNKVAVFALNESGPNSIGSGGNGIQGSTGFRVSFQCTLPISNFIANQ